MLDAGKAGPVRVTFAAALAAAGPPHGRTGARHASRRLRRRHRRGRVGRLRVGQPAVGRPVHAGARAGGGPQRLPVGRVHPHARRADVPQRQPVLRLALRVRAGAAHGRQADPARPGQGARRLQQHQRDDLPARQPAGLRAVGGRPRDGHLGLRPLPALLHAHGELPGRRGGRRVPRAQRAARPRARARPRTRCSAPSCRRRRRRATRSPTTSTGTARRASPGSTATSTAGGGCPRPARTCIP